MLLFAILLALMNGALRGRPRLLLWMPVLFALWANLHGGWIVGLGVLGLWSACAILARTIPWPWAAAGTILAGLGTLATPYGPELWRFLWETVGLGRADITEWQPLTSDPPRPDRMGRDSRARRHWRGAGAAGPRCRCLCPRWSSARWRSALAGFEGFFALTNVVLLAPCFAALGPERLPLSRRPTRAEMVTVGTMCLAGLAAVGFAVRNQVGCVTVGGPDPDESPGRRKQRPSCSCSAISSTAGCSPTSTTVKWPSGTSRHGCASHMTGGARPVYSEVVQQAHQRFYSAAPDASYARLLKADYIWLPHRLPAVGLLERDGWVAIFRGTKSVVLAREGGAYTQPDPWAGPRCFPGP